MENKFKYFDVYIKSHCSNNENLKLMDKFTISFDKISIIIKGNTINNILNAIYEALDKETNVNIESFSITRFSTDNVNKLLNISQESLWRYNIRNLLSCYVCHQKSPIFRIKGFYDDEELYLCKRHLRQLYNYLNNINLGYELTIKPNGYYEVSVKD